MNDSYEKYWKRKYKPEKLNEAEIDVYDIDAEAAAMTIFRGRDQMIPVGQYTRLLVGDKLVMSDTPFEYRTHSQFFRTAYGNVLVNGLGLGCCVDYLLKTKNTAIESITVIEKSHSVVDLVLPYIQHPKLTVICADAFEYKPPKGQRYNFVWHDIWPDLCTDYLKQMTRLHRKYGRRCDNQESWGRTILKRQVEKDKRRRCYWL